MHTGTWYYISLGIHARSLKCFKNKLEFLDNSLQFTPVVKVEKISYRNSEPAPRGGGRGGLAPPIDMLGPPINNCALFQTLTSPDKRLPPFPLSRLLCRYCARSPKYGSEIKNNFCSCS